MILWVSQISTEETRRLLAIFAVLSCLGLTAPNTQVCSADQANRNETLEAYPKTFKITGKRDPLQLIVTVSQNEQTLDVTRDCNYDTDTDMVAVSETGLVSPKVNGQTTITIRWKNLTTQVTITVANADKPQLISFDYDVLPVLAQTGCSGGSCHGAPHGKVGFQLSLFGSDRELDRVSLTQEMFGRRINPIEPAKSLILQKPSMQIAHQGGKRFSVSERPYTVLHDWIAEGCRDSETEPACIGIEVFPGQNRLLASPAWQQQFSVIATFEDGKQRDVTQLAKYETSDPLVAVANRAGLVTGLRRGESAIIVRYLNHIKTPLMTFVRDNKDFQWAASAPANEVDVHVHAKLKKLQFLPTGRCQDHEFVRRVFIDTIGILPTEQEASTFITDTSSDKRKTLINGLLQRKEFARFWAQKWGDLLRVSTKLIGTASSHKFNRWLETSVLINQPYDAFARDILLATGSTRQYPAGNFYRSAGDTSDAMETAAQVFLGTRIQCAKCHNHPFERWTQENYYGLSAFFNRIERSRTSRKEEILLWSRDDGEVTLPTTGKTVKPWVPGVNKTGKESIEKSTGDRRQAFATWLTTDENPLFAKVEVNRIWTHLMGRGVVEPFDDFRDSNPPANTPLLDSLAAKFIESGYDRKQIIRLILNSETYQASSQPENSAQDGLKYASHYNSRILTAEQLVDALGFVTGKPKQFFGVPRGTLATWLPAPDLRPHDRGRIGDVEFLKVFGQPERQSACECERSDDVSLGQALELINGKLVTDMLSDRSNTFHQQLDAGKNTTEIIESLYKRALCRSASEAEIKIHNDYLTQHKDVHIAMEDICWAILNRTEFLFQH
ncbi:DUF1553 domain-containing protein [bacterium]|nr:DUF1553 domain-containing protein [bacterium]